MSDLNLRDQVAATLMDRDEGGGCLNWALEFIQEHQAATHCGDCTKESHACLRCQCDRVLADADAIILMVHEDMAEGLKKEMAGFDADDLAEMEKLKQI